ncbi:MAG: GGDEF domain-containing protein [Actinomycetota bacterium]|nr:GGDEF domain-containing protein [Actinomycetota bacterium]
MEFAAAVLTALALANAAPTAESWRRLAVLFALGVVFEELARKVGKQRILISSGPQADMTSVWTFAGALVVAPGSAALLAVVLAGYMWIRQQRQTGQFLYRKFYSAATIVLACLAASAVLNTGGHSQLVPTDYSALSVALALAVYTCVNRLLISVAVVLAGNPITRSIIIGKWDENLLELATLCLGYVTAAVGVHQPWLAVVVLIPMVLLQRGALVEQLEQMSTTDAKTQLLNALAWHQLAARELTRAGRTPSAAILVIDLDHFKAVNDVHGHLVGDAALFQVGLSIKQELRQGDVVGRFGGEEFVVMLPDLEVEAASQIAERVRARIATISLSELQGAHTDGGVCRHALSASIGVAMFPDHAPDLGGLLQAADTALFVAKHAGRNRIALAGPPPQPDTAAVPLAG